MSASLIQQSSPIVIYGAPRSGTTYLAEILNQHPEILITNETRVFVWMHKSLHVLTREDASLFEQRARFVQYLSHSYPDLIRNYYQSIRPGITYWGDKNPHYAARENDGCLDTIATLFPGTHFIHLIRDGRDVAMSLIRKGWLAFDDAHSTWLDHVEVGIAHGLRQAPDRYHAVRYEDLVRNDLSVIGELFDQLGIPLHPNVVGFCRDQQRSRTPINAPTRELAGGAAASDWKRLLAPDQRLRSLERLGPLLIQCGYETEASLMASVNELRETSKTRPIDHLRRVVRDLVPPHATLLVASDDDDRLLLGFERQVCRRFPISDQALADGHPEDDAAAIAQLEDLHIKGGNFLLFPNAAFGWLESHKALGQYLHRHYQRIAADSHAVIYRLSRPVPEGHLDAIASGSIVGWVWDRTSPLMPVEIDVTVDGEHVLTGIASSYRPDLEQAGIGDGRHAFAVALPKKYLDGQTHAVQVCVAGTEGNLPGSPMRFCFAADA